MAKVNRRLKLSKVDASSIGRVEILLNAVRKECIIEATKVLKKGVQNVIEENNKVASGKLKQSIRRRSKNTSTESSGSVYVDGSLRYGRAVIKGIPAGRVVSANSLKRWIKFKQRRGVFADFVDDKAITRLSHRIQASIKKKGVAGFDYMKIAVEQYEKEMNRAVQTKAKELFNKSKRGAV